ncbi:RHS repeat domain-containing protein [uncultured Bacteroides sp.]|uniref:RHS repeat domain-containing protein n=1 Tax=uncultured Bacteroides sp. TaxID=162156 RepID=UPI003747E262
MNGTTPTYHYYIQDHQGNNRVVFNQSGTVEQTNHFYPFGMTFGEGIDNSDNRYKYNNKELDRMHGLDLYDYGARHYDAAIGRWGVIDPLAEKYYSISPYAYCLNNSVRLIDPVGMDAWSTNDPKEIADFCRQVSSGQSPDISSWNHQTDEVYLSKNSPNYFTYDSKNMMISVQWGTIENNEPVINCKRFDVKKLKNKKLYKQLLKLNDAVGMTADVMSSIGGAAKIAGCVTEKALSHVLTRPTTVVGAALAGVPAAYRLLFNSYNDKDAITLGIALGACALEFSGEGEVIDIAGTALSVMSVGWDMYNTYPEN